jgi:hypothetical protein
VWNASVKKYVVAEGSSTKIPWVTVKVKNADGLKTNAFTAADPP